MYTLRITHLASGRTQLLNDRLLKSSVKELEPAHRRLTVALFRKGCLVEFEKL